MAKTEAAEKVMKKKNARQVKTSNEPTGFFFEGKYIGMVEQPFIDKDTGETKTLHNLIVEDANGDRLKILADAGLRTSLADAMVKTGEYFRAVKQEKIKIGKGRTMNQWDILQNA